MGGDAAAPRTGPGVRQVLFVGDPRRLHFSKLSAGYVVAPSMAPDLGAVQSMVRAPEEWRLWRGLFVDTAIARDVEVATFFERQQPALLAAGVRELLLLDPRHAHLSPQGGVGKTSVALAVAEYLSRVKLGCKVAMFDTDFFDGNVALSQGPRSHGPATKRDSLLITSFATPGHAWVWRPILFPRTTRKRLW